MVVKIPVSWGELFDKLTILEIKQARIDNQQKLANINKELKALRQVCSDHQLPEESLQEVIDDLRRTNESLWEIEDDIRDKERANEFDEEFIALARNVYITNDLRSKVKKDLNLHLGSQIVEEKSYQDY